MLKRYVVAIGVGNFIAGVNIHIVGGLLLEITRSLGISIGQAGTLIAATAFTAFIGAPVCATLGSGIDRRRLLTGALLLCALSASVAAFTQDYGQLMAARLVGAIATSIFFPQAAATLAMLVKETDRAKAMSLALMGVGFASVLGVPLGIMVGSEFGWRTTMGALGAGSALSALLVWWVLPSGLHVPPLRLAGWLAVMRTPELMYLVFASALGAACNGGTLSYLAPMVAALVPGADGKVISSLFLVHGAAWLLSTSLVALVVGRFGASPMAYAFAACILLSFLVRPFGAQSLAFVVLMQVFWSVGGSGFATVQQARLVSAAPLLAAASVALNSSFNMLGVAAGAMVAAHAWDFAGPRYLTWVMLPFLLGSLILSILAGRSSRRAALTV